MLEMDYITYQLIEIKSELKSLINYIDETLSRNQILDKKFFEFESRNIEVESKL